MSADRVKFAARLQPIRQSASRYLLAAWQWLKAPRDPITWKQLRALVTDPPGQLPRSWLGRFLLVGVIFVLLLIVGHWYSDPQWDVQGVKSYPQAGLINPILGGLGALFLIYAAIRQARTAGEQAETARKQARVAADRHEAQTKADLQRRITETFSKAVEQLGSEKMEVRVGGIYTLERLASETLATSQVAEGVEEGSSPDLYWTVMETLTAFVPLWQTGARSGDGTCQRL